MNRRQLFARLDRVRLGTCRAYEEDGAALREWLLDSSDTERIRWLTDDSEWERLSQLMAASARGSAPYVVTDDMLTLLEMAMIDVPPFGLHPSDLLTPSGFVVFERPLPARWADDDDETFATDPITVDGLAWQVAPAAAGTLAENDNDGAVLAWTIFHEIQGTAVPVVSDGFGPWPWHRSVDRHDGSDLPKVFSAFLRLILERYVSTERDPGDRATRRGRARANLDDVADTVVVTLRRLKNRAKGEEESLPIDWAHRWLVRGHWRQQWYPSEQRHAPRYIAPYIKGPENAPFVEKRHLFSVER